MPTKLHSPRASRPRGSAPASEDEERDNLASAVCTPKPLPTLRPAANAWLAGPCGARLSLNPTAAPCTVPAHALAAPSLPAAHASRRSHLCAERGPCRLTWSRRLLPDRHHLRGAKLRRPGHAGHALCHQRRPNRASSTLSLRQCTPPAFLLTPSRILSLLRHLELREEFAATPDLWNSFVRRV